MVDYMNLEEQTEADFARARRRAFLRRIGTRLRNGPAGDGLLCFEDARRRLGPRSAVPLGLRVVRSTDVVGSVGRCSQFDRAFLPTRASTEPKWKRVDRIFHLAEEFPPVTLYKIGDAYFVLDGNHRVSVARFHGVEWIDAEVTEFGIPPRAEISFDMGDKDARRTSPHVSEVTKENQPRTEGVAEEVAGPTSLDETFARSTRLTRATSRGCGTRSSRSSPTPGWRATSTGPRLAGASAATGALEPGKAREHLRSDVTSKMKTQDARRPS
jgi:hypothetical protein